MGWAYNLLEEAMIAAVENGSYLFDPAAVNIFVAIAEEQPLLKDYLEIEMRAEKVRLPDGTQQFARYETMLAEAQTPTDPTNIASTAKTVKLVEVMAAAALEKMRDPKIAICDKLSCKDGATSYNLNADAHEATLGAHNVNDAVE
eukprot:2411844-Pleurochrysis_carterae.AAC.1